MRAKGSVEGGKRYRESDATQKQGSGGEPNAEPDISCETGINVSCWPLITIGRATQEMQAVVVRGCSFESHTNV